MALTAHGVGHVYSQGTSFAVPALAGVDLALRRGELMLVLGPTGSGKSTLLRILAGVLAATEGEALADGSPLTGPGRAARGTVGLVFQDPESQLFAETLAEDVAFGPLNLGASQREAEEAASEALTRVGLDPREFGPRSPFGLSGGESRRAALAGVLAMRPPYLLLDEPTAGLDAAGRESVLSVVQEARREAGIMVVTHDAEQFLASADTVLVLAGGRPEFAGPASELLSDPSPLTRAGLLVPDVLRVQILAEERGIRIPARTADPRLAARLLAEAGGWTR